MCCFDLSKYNQCLQNLSVKIVNFCMHHIWLQILFIKINLEQKGETLFAHMQECLSKMLPLVIIIREN